MRQAACGFHVICTTAHVDVHLLRLCSEHPWFKESLPPYLDSSAAPSRSEAKHEFDVEIGAQVAAIGYKGCSTPEDVKASVLLPTWNEVNVCYDLLLDQKRRRLRSIELEEMRLGRVPPAPPQRPLTFGGPEAAAAILAASAGSVAGPREDPPAGGGASPTPGAGAGAGAGSLPKPRRRRWRRWYLGIQSKKDPAHVMSEVFRALMEGNLVRCGSGFAGQLVV